MAAGLAAIAPATDVVVIHDAARPFCTPDLIDRTIDAAAESGAATAALPAFDTVKEGRLADGVAVVGATLPRERIFLVQTPQAFRAGLLRDAVERGGGGAEATDETTLVERAGHPVRLVQGDVRNFKVTSPDDLALAGRIAAARPLEDTRRRRLRPAPVRGGTAAGARRCLHPLRARPAGPFGCGCRLSCRHRRRARRRGRRRHRPAVPPTTTTGGGGP